MAANKLALIEGTFTGTGQSDAVKVFGKFNVVIDKASGPGNATVVIERSFDAGVSFLPVSKNSDGDPASYATTVGFNGSLDEPESDVLYRLNCTVHGSGSVPYRISR